MFITLVLAGCTKGGATADTSTSQGEPYDADELTTCAPTPWQATGDINLHWNPALRAGGTYGAWYPPNGSCYASCTGTSRIVVDDRTTTEGEFEYTLEGRLQSFQYTTVDEGRVTTLTWEYDQGRVVSVEHVVSVDHSEAETRMDVEYVRQSPYPSMVALTDETHRFEYDWDGDMPSTVQVMTSEDGEDEEAAWGWNLAHEGSSLVRQATYQDDDPGDELYHHDIEWEGGLPTQIVSTRGWDGNWNYNAADQPTWYGDSTGEGYAFEYEADQLASVTWTDDSGEAQALHEFQYTCE